MQALFTSGPAGTFADSSAQRPWSCITDSMVKHPNPVKRVSHLGSGDASMPISLETLQEHRRLKTSVWKHIRSARLLVVLTVPLIYACVFPFLLLDASVAIYHAICFPIFRIPKVRRRDYLIFDRGRLAYLNAIEKAGCLYCSYANGLLAYVAEIAARTEQRFCPIKHEEAISRPHSRYQHFLPYGNARAFRARSEKIAGAYGDLKHVKVPAD